jgi:hypothetical protein
MFMDEAALEVDFYALLLWSTYFVLIKLTSLQTFWATLMNLACCFFPHGNVIWTSLFLYLSWTLVSGCYGDTRNPLMFGTLVCTAAAKKMGMFLVSIVRKRFNASQTSS